MFSTTVTDTGQITIPKKIQDHLKLVSGSKLCFVIDEEGQVKLLPLKVSIEQMSGMLHRPSINKTTVAEMEFAIYQGANDWN